MFTYDIFFNINHNKGMGNCCMKQKYKWDGRLVVDMDCPYCQKYRTNDLKKYEKHMAQCIDVTQYFQYDIDHVIKK
jgi:hypothetical protein